jgi:archaellum component FlaC
MGAQFTHEMIIARSEHSRTNNNEDNEDVENPGEDGDKFGNEITNLTSGLEWSP